MMRTFPGTGATTLLRLLGSLVGLTIRTAPFRTVPDDLDLFAAIPPTRSGAALDHIVYVGPLSPESGAADLLVALASWAEQHPARPIEITWAGIGDLAGVFEAQPLPDRLTQHFAGVLDRAGLVSLFARASLMVVPLVDGGAPVLEALAAGLLIVGGRRVSAIRPLVGADGPAWGYDERKRLALAAALSAALNEAPAACDARRRAGRSAALGVPIVEHGSEPGHEPGAETSGEVLRRPAPKGRLVSSEVTL